MQDDNGATALNGMMQG